MDRRRERNRDTALAAFVFLAAALVATYPLIRRASHAVAGGLGDPILVTTVLAWDADRIEHGLTGFWDPPYLYPHPHTLAYSEHMLGVAMFTAPLQWLTRNPVLVYNVAYIASYVLAGFGMFLLTRRLFGRTDAAILAGLAFELTPYRLAQSSHLQMLMNGWMPVGLWALHNYFDSGSRRWMAAFVAAYLVCGLSNGYYLYFFLVPAAILGAVEFARPRVPRTRMAFDFAAAGAIIAVAMAPIARVYYELQHVRGFVRSADELPGLSAHLGDYLRGPFGIWDWGGLVPQGEGERQVYQGLVVMLFAGIGVGTMFTGDRHGAVANDQRRSVIAYVLVAIVALLLSTGPHRLSPYGLFFSIVPGFNGLRVPARFAAVVILAWAALAAAGFAFVLSRLPGHAGGAAAVALALTIIAEGQHAVGLSAVDGFRDRSWERVAYDWLRGSPPGALLELKITEMDDFHPFTPIYQLNALDHRHPIVNGYAGWKSNLQELLGGVESPLRDASCTGQTLAALRRIGVRYVMLHESTFPNPEAAERMTAQIRGQADQIVEEHRWPGLWAWRLSDATPVPSGASGLVRLDASTLETRASHQERRLPLIFDGNLDTRWMTGVRQAGDEWIDIRLARPASVARLEIVSASRSLNDYPRRLRIVGTGPDGASRTLFDDVIVDRYLESVAFDDRHPSVVVDLPDNVATTLRLSQVGRGSAWWSIHELRLWERHR